MGALKDDVSVKSVCSYSQLYAVYVCVCVCLQLCIIITDKQQVMNKLSDLWIDENRTLK